MSLRRQIVPLQETRQNHDTSTKLWSKSLSKFIGSVLSCYHTISIAEICNNSTDSTNKGFTLRYPSEQYNRLGSYSRE